MHLPERGREKAFSGARPIWSGQGFLEAVKSVIPCGIAVSAPDGTQVYVDERFCDLVGWEAGELLGAKPPYPYWPEDAVDPSRAHDYESVYQRPSSNLELTFQRRGGERIDVLVCVAPVLDPEGETLGWVSSVMDNSDRKRTERRHSAAQHVGLILSRCRTAEEAGPQILAAIGEDLGWDLGIVWRIDSDARVMSSWNSGRAGNAAAEFTDGIRFAPGEGLVGRVWASGEPLWIPNVQAAPWFLRAGAAKREGIHGAFAFPVPAGSAPALVFEFFSRDERGFDPDLRETAALFSRQIGRLIGRENAEAAPSLNGGVYRTIVEAANEGVWLIDTSGRTCYANRKLAAMLGYTTAELENLTPFDLCFAEDVELARERVGQNLAGNTEQFDFRFRRKDGTELLTLACTSPVRNTDGQITGALGLFSDVTDRKRAEEAAYHLAAIVESSDDAIISKTLDGTIKSWNSGAERLYGYTAEEAIGKSMRMLLPPDRPDEESDILDRLQRGETVEHFETVRKRKDGRLIDVATTISPVRDKQGRVTGASSVTRDISERNQLEIQLRETQKLESLGVLAGGVAHDFNNLLVGIMGNASLALDTVPPENPARTMIEGVVRASERAAMLTSQLLAYSGRGRFVVQPVDLSFLVREIVSLIHTSIPKGVHIEFHLAEDLPRVEADMAQLQQLVMNLVINAAEAIGDSRAGTVVIRTGVEWSEEESPRQLICLQVQDNGSGMDEETQRRIFDPFFTTKFTGRGLGLAAVLGIVRGHNGTIRVESLPGRGSTFTVLFPVAGTVTGKITPAALPELRGTGTILVVDDEEVVRSIARNVLQSYGYEVLLAGDGRQAIECVRQAPEIKLVLLDLTMPVMSGEEALGHLRQLRPELPVILSSGFDETEAMQRFQDKDLSGFLQKPYTAERLATRVKAVLEPQH